MTGCVLLSDAALSTLADGVGARLRALAAARNDRYTFVGVNALLNKCERLTDLDLSACPGVAHVGVVVALRDGQVPDPFSTTSPTT